MTHRPTTVLREAATLLPSAGVLGFMLLLAVRSDSGARELAVALGAVLVFHVLPGALVWRSLRPPDGWLVEDLVMGLVIGSCLAVPVQVLTVATGLGLLPFAVPVLVVALLLGLPASRARIRSRTARALPWWWGTAVCASMLYPLLAFVDALAHPLRWRGYANRYVDLPFHEGLVGELVHRFPLHYPYLANEEVAYHWFGHAWTANIVALSGTGIDVTLWRIVPALVHVAAPLAVAVVTVRLTRAAWTGPVAAVVAYLGSSVHPWDLRAPTLPFSVASPSQEFAVLLLPAVIALLAMRWRGELPRWNLLFVTFVMVVAAGAKGTTMSVLVPGLLLATIAMALLDRSRLRMLATDTAVAIAVLVVLSLTVFRGSGSSLKVDLLTHLVASSGGALGVPDAQPWTAVGLLVAVLAAVKWALTTTGLVGGLLTRAGRVDPALWALLGAAASGFGALVVFSHPGNSQLYFFKTALVPLGIGVAYGLGLLAEGATRPLRSCLVGAGSGAVAVAAALAAVELLPGGRVTLTWGVIAVIATCALVAAGGAVAWRGSGPAGAGLAAGIAMVVVAALPAAANAADFRPAERQVSGKRIAPTWVPSSAVTAYRWLRDQSDPDDLLATNRHCAGRDTERCSRRAFTLAAYSERRVLVEGWAYVPKASALYDPAQGITATKVPYWDPELLETNDAFFTDPSDETRDRLVELGVDWVVVDKAAPHAETLEPFARRRYQSRHVDVYELLPDS